MTYTTVTTAQYAGRIRHAREKLGYSKIVLGGWSGGGGGWSGGGFSGGGLVAYEMAQQLRAAGDEVSLVVLLDTVQPSEPIPDTLDEAEARWKRYSEFAKRTYGLDVEVPRDFLAEHGDGTGQPRLEQTGDRRLAGS